MYLILHRVLFLIFCFTSASFANSNIVVSDINSISILENSEILIDDKNLDIKKVIKSNDFKKFHNDYLNIGITKKAVWVKFTLENPTDTKVERLLIINNALLDKFILYQHKKSNLTILKPQPSNLHILYPSYKVILEINQKQTYYFYVKNTLTGTRFGLALKSEAEYLSYDKKQQFFYGLKLGLVLSLLILNVILFFYSKNRFFLYYSFFVFITLYWQSSYLGLIHAYFSPEFVKFDKYLSGIKVNIILITSSIFSIHFLQTYKIKYIHNIYKFFIYISIFNIIFFSQPWFNYNIKIPVFFAALYSIYTIYASISLYKSGVKQARLYILGTGIVVVVYLIIMSDIVGLTKIMSYVPDLILHAVVLEAIILSLAFIDRYKILQEEKEEADYRLLKESKEREEKIKIEVTNKTKQLQEALQTQELLFKELHHRVKNNLQMILSINDLQKEEYESPFIKEIFQKWENRIQAIAKTHELIYMNNDIEMIDMSDYIENLIENLEDSYLTRDIIFQYDIDSELPLNKAVYLGLIINELVSNSIKYAFNTNKGTISIVLNNEFLQVSDNGKGYDIKDISLHSTGLNLVTMLAQEQLDATLELHNTNGVSYTIRFKA